jgi:Ca2+-binding RTX toxin-like protein
MWLDSSGYLHLENTQATSNNMTVYAWHDGYGASTIGAYVEQITFDDEGNTVWDLTGGLTLTGDNGGGAWGGTNYADTITGGSGNDNLYGYAGNDTLIGLAGTNTFYGAAGNDTFVLSSGFGDNTINEYTSAGTDTIRLTSIDPDDIRMWTDGYGTLYLQDVNDTSHSITVYAATTGYGTSETDIGSYVESVAFDAGYSTTWNLASGLFLTGTTSGDTLYGSQYADTLKGLAGNDYLYGNRGNDTIWGGGGSDTIYGGAGADTFKFDSTATGASVTIQDFSDTAGDKLDLVSLLTGHYDPMQDAINDFVTATSTSWDTLISVDLDGTGTSYSSTQIATLANITGLTVNDMISNSNLLVPT